MKKKVHVWNGNNQPFDGKVYKRGEVIPEKVIANTQRLNALTGYGLILEKTVEVEEVAKASSTSVKTTTSSTKKKKKSAPEKTVVEKDE